jgi:ABC-2 type transport system permease protein
MTTAVAARRRAGSPAGPPAGKRSSLRLLAHQVRYEQLSFWRNPQSAVFTFIFPVVFVVIMGALFGGIGKSSYFGGLSALQYYVPTIAALSVLGSCYGQLAVALAARRQAGILKRMRATPLPAWAYFAGLLAHCVIVSEIDIALIVVVGRLYGVPFPSHWLAIMLTQSRPPSASGRPWPAWHGPCDHVLSPAANAQQAGGQSPATPRTCRAGQ